MKCINCSKEATAGSVFCASCHKKAHTAGVAAPKGTFKKKVTSSKVKIMKVN